MYMFSTQGMGRGLRRSGCGIEFVRIGPAMGDSRVDLTAFAGLAEFFLQLSTALERDQCREVTVMISDQ